MIIDEITHWERYRSFMPQIESAARFLLAPATEKLAPGRVEVGAGMFAIVQEYNTIARGAPREWEAHRRYIDLQYISHGEELVGRAPVALLRDPESYDAERDALTAPDAEGATDFRLCAGQFAILFPHDAHSPGHSVAAPTGVRKIVVKIPAQ